MGYSSVYVKFYRPKLTHRRDEKDPTAHRYDFITLFSFCKVRIGSFFVLFLPDLPRFPPPVGRHQRPPVRGRPSPLTPHAPVRAEMRGCCPASVRSLRRVLFVAPYTIARAVTSPRRAGPLLRTPRGTVTPRRAIRCSAFRCAAPRPDRRSARTTCCSAPCQDSRPAGGEISVSVTFPRPARISCHGGCPPSIGKEAVGMKIVVVHSPRFLRPLLRRLFGIGRA